MTAPELPLFEPFIRAFRTIEIPHPGKTDTSAQAAEKVKPHINETHNDILDLLSTNDHTADEAAAFFKVDILSIRPRFTELKELGLIVKTDKRRKNAKGNSQIVWTRKV